MLVQNSYMLLLC